MNTLLSRGCGAGVVLLTSSAALLAVATTAKAQSVAIDFVVVGYVGNISDNAGLGSVNYEYQIGKYEVTNSQYAAFLNTAAKTDTHALYNASMGFDGRFGGGITRSGTSGSYSYAVKAGYENKPVNHVSWWDAARFANWVGTGDTEGALPGAAYKLNGGFPTSVEREADAVVGLPTQDEWIKAAYFQPASVGGPSESYWLYPTMSDVQPTSAAPGPGANQANFFHNDGIDNGVNGGFAAMQSTNPNLSQPYVTDVGSYTSSASYFGTFDQGGNVRELTMISPGFLSAWGGSFFESAASFESSGGSSTGFSNESYFQGFRVVGFATIPEPSAYAAIAGLMSFGVVMWRRRLKRGSI